MRTVEGVDITTPQLDKEGYLIRTETWTKEVAQTVAQEEVPEGLTDDHWMVVNHMRDYYIEYGNIPPLRKLARDTGFSLRYMQKLFPNGLAKGACKIAGIPSNAIKPSFLYP